MLIMLLMTENVESIYGMVTRIITKHRTQQLSTTKGDLRPRLANLQSKVAKLKCFSVIDNFISWTFSLFLFKITLLILRVRVTNGTQTANSIFKTSKNYQAASGARLYRHGIKLLYA